MINDNTILLIDDDLDVLSAYRNLLEDDYSVYVESDPSVVLDKISLDWIGVIVTDVSMPEISGLELLVRLQAFDKNIPVILITGHGDIPMAIEAMKKGAYHFLEKPINPEQLLNYIETALDERRLYIQKKLWQQKELTLNFIGVSGWAKQHRQYLQKLSEIELPVFIFGELGTGKTLSARYLHQISGKKGTVEFIELFDMYSPENLQNKLDESVFSTLVIENIEYLSLPAQRLLLKLEHSQEKRFRLILSSHYSPAQLLEQGKLLPELFYLFSLTQLECLPLSKRLNDIEVLFRHFVDLTCSRLNKKKPAINKNILQNLLVQNWVGNVNQLMHAAELFAIGAVILENKVYTTMIEDNVLSLDSLVSEYEKKIITEILDRFQGKVQAAADYLQIPRKKLYLRMKKYELNKKHYKE
ncbi:sigma-54-dependent transcriptional regulator [Testudinibacter aquarius]|uniref:Sigma-54-dependent Fis family transcriptional regulator n=1 Tax=Testudinibacter aquarius TaxID=1524974 RepID=A0A4R3YBT1_9PAST|nr:response regulator [Testudinibacter aquarius]KAE9529819.1 transcriptional regulator [Testudinibacter aquarius]TCV89420.1 two-component system phosphoglycerate transport system response regulator PgtA [Testudinibacter aquarius]TNG85561.1 sigma-54-dependent Fis family transcriptional regulator [Testudinibacter aquarius]